MNFLGATNSNTPLTCGKIIQRFPEKDWPDTPFIEGIEWVGFNFDLVFNI